MGDPSETILNLVIVGVALFAGGAIILPLVGNLSKTLGDLGGGAAAAAPATTPTPVLDSSGNPVLDQNGNPVTTPAPTTTPLPTNTGNPLQDLLNTITNATSGGAGAQPPAVTPPTANANPSLCKSKYFGKCDTECKSAGSNCTNCRIACGLSANLAMVDDIYDDEDMPMPIGYHVVMA